MPTLPGQRSQAQSEAVRPEVEESTPNRRRRPSWLVTRGGTAQAASLTRLVAVLVGCAMLAGPLALALFLTGAATPDPAPTPRAGTSNAGAVSTQAAVEEFAQNFVVTWLTTPSGQEKDLARFYPDGADATLPRSPAVATNPAVSAVSHSAGSWTVIVAATVSAPSSQPTAEAAPAQRRYFQVAVQTQGSSLVAEALPAPVAAPATGKSVETDYRYRATATDPVFTSTSGFLDGLLTGSGDVSRLTSPGVSIRAVEPAPYREVSVQDVLVDRDPAEVKATRDGVELHVLVSAIAQGASQDDQISVQYALLLRSRAGRWEIAAVEPHVKTTSPEAQSSASGIEGDPGTS